MAARETFAITRLNTHQMLRQDVRVIDELVRIGALPRDDDQAVLAHDLGDLRRKKVCDSVGIVPSLRA